MYVVRICTWTGHAMEHRSLHIFPAIFLRFFLTAFWISHSDKTTRVVLNDILFKHSTNPIIREACIVNRLRIEGSRLICKFSCPYFIQFAYYFQIHVWCQVIIYEHVACLRQSLCSNVKKTWVSLFEIMIYKLKALIIWAALPAETFVGSWFQHKVYRLPTNTTILPQKRGTVASG